MPPPIFHGVLIGGEFRDGRKVRFCSGVVVEVVGEQVRRDVGERTVPRRSSRRQGPPARLRRKRSRFWMRLHGRPKRWLRVCVEVHFTGADREDLLIVHPCPACREGVGGLAVVSAVLVSDSQGDCFAGAGVETAVCRDGGIDPT